MDISVFIVQMVFSLILRGTLAVSVVMGFLTLLFLIRLLESLGLFRFLELLRVLRLLMLQFYVVVKTLSVIAWLVGVLELVPL